jgi:nicotinamidase-related amidase
MNPNLFKIDKNTLLLIVDVQERLMRVMPDPQGLEKRIGLLVELARTYGMPVVLTEQYPQGLGPTAEGVRKALDAVHPLGKMTFSICGEDTVVRRLKSHPTEKIILSGIEAHICVLQSCLDLLEAGYQVFVPYDAVDSRKPGDKRVGLGLMEKAGAVITGCEILAFQLLGKAGTPDFKRISALIKNLP